MENDEENVAASFSDDDQYDAALVNYIKMRQQAKKSKLALKVFLVMISSISKRRIDHIPICLSLLDGESSL